MNERQSNSRPPASALARALALGWRVWPEQHRGRERLTRGREVLERYPDLFEPTAEVCLCDEPDCTTVRDDEVGHLCIHCGQGFDNERNCYGCDYEEDDDGYLHLREDDGHGLHG